MADVFPKAKRSEVMAAVRGAGTTPERIVESLVRGLGYRPTLHAADLAGKPDLVFRRRRKVIFVHGCFWHRHRCEAGRSTPSTNVEYWLKKFARNTKRDRLAMGTLQRAGWSVLTVWECQTRVRQRNRLLGRLRKFLTGS